LRGSDDLDVTQRVVARREMGELSSKLCGFRIG
jgi:hypothetical protein